MASKRIYYHEFKRSLDTDPLRPVYFFSGAETFLKEQGVMAIVEKAILPAERSMNLEYLYAGADVSGMETKERAATLPFLAACRVIVVRQVEKWRAADFEALESYLQNPSPSTILILVSLEERLKTVGLKSLAARAYHVECYPLFDSQVPGWIERRVGEAGKQIAHDAVELLIERVGQELGELDNEITKLVNYCGAKRMIEHADVAEVAGFIRQNTVHEMNLALGMGQAAKAIQLANAVMTEGMQPIQILGAVAWHFRNLSQYRRRWEAGESWDELLGGVRHPQARKEWQEQIPVYAYGHFAMIFQELLQLDEIIKTGRGSWEFWLERSIWRICQQPAANKNQAGRMYRPA